MGTEELFNEIRSLPTDRNILLIEKILKPIRRSSFEKVMLMAAERLEPDYEEDQELTIFTELDYEKDELSKVLSIGY